MISLNNFALILVSCTFFSFFIITPTLINFIILCEIVWVGIYNIILYFGIEAAALTYLVYGLLILCLAAVESVIGLTLVVYKFIIFGTIKFRGLGLKGKKYAYNSFLG